MGDHADDLINDMLFGDWDNYDHHYADSLAYRHPQGDRYPITCKANFTDDEEQKQPEYQQLVVTQLHRQTEKSYCVSGVVTFDTPYRGMKQFEFLADWIPLSQCILTGDTARIPQWLIRSRWQQRINRQAQFTDLVDEAGRVERRRTY